MRAPHLFALVTALLAVAGCATTSNGNNATSANKSAAPSKIAAPAASPGPASPSLASPSVTASRSAAPPPPSYAPPPPPAPISAEPNPTTVVQEYFAAINAGDYATAWELGGDNLGETYAAFAAGFADTLSDQLIVTGTSGSAVYVDLIAEHTDGTQHEYAGSYYVHNGQITSAAVHELTAPAPAPAPVAPNAPSAGLVPHALCNDGTISYSTHDEGTCSDHGGVAVWYWH